jgi:hypothetical protein
MNGGISRPGSNSKSYTNMFEYDIADTHIELGSLHESRRGSLSLSQQGGPLALPGDLPDVSLEDYRLPGTCILKELR